MASREIYKSDCDEFDGGLSGKKSKKKRTYRAYDQCFRSEWLADEELKGWLEDGKKKGSAFCKWCKCTMHAKRSVFKKHLESKKHKSQAEVVASGSNETTGSSPPPRMLHLTSSRMCSRVLSESPVKIPPSEEPVIDLQKGCDLRDPAVKNLLTTSSPSISPLKNGVEGTSTMSLLPASLLLRKSFDFMASEVSTSRKRSSKPFTVSIEGNIGSGKSTFLNYFSALPGVSIFQEPIDLWTNLGGNNLLGKLYEDPERWSFLFQSYVQLTRLNIHLKEDNDCHVKLIERSLQNNRYCFVESGHDCGHLKDAEYSVLCEYYDLLESRLDIGIDLIVYLRSTPEIVHDRMLKRGRSEEAGVPLEYLKQVHNYYEKWLLQHKPRSPPAPVLVIDADKNLNEVLQQCVDKKSVILGEKPMTHPTDKKDMES